MKTVRLIHVGNSLMFSLPRWFLHQLNAKQGDVFLVELVGKTVHYTPMERITAPSTAPHTADAALEAFAKDGGS